MSFDLASFLLGKNIPNPVNGFDFESGTWTPDESVAHGEISFAKIHAKRPTIALVCANDAVYDDTLNTNYSFAFIAYEDFALPCPVNESTSKYYAQTIPASRTTSAVGFSNTGAKMIGYSYTEEIETPTVDYQQFYVTESSIKPYTGANTRYWKSGKQYKWVAIWM